MKKVTKICVILSFFSIALVGSQGSSSSSSSSTSSSFVAPRVLRNPLIKSTNRASTDIADIVNEYFGEYQMIQNVPAHQGLVGLALSKDGNMVVFIDGTVCKIWEKKDNNHWNSVASFNTEDTQITALALSADKKMIVVGSANGTLKIWRSIDGKWMHNQPCDETLTETWMHNSRISSIIISNDKRMIVSHYADGIVIVWDSFSARHYCVVARIATTSSAPIALSADKKIMITGHGQSKINIWHENDGEWTVPAIFPSKHLSGIKSLALSSDKSMLVSGSLDDTIKIWKAPDGEWTNQPEEALTLQAHNDGVPTLVLTEDKKMILAGFSDGTIKIWHDSNGQWHVRDMQTSSRIESLALSTDKKTMVTSSSTGFKIWHYEPNIPYAIANFLAKPITLGQTAVLKLLSEYKKLTFSPLSHLKYSAATHPYLRDVEIERPAYLLLYKAFGKNPKMLEIVRAKLMSFPNEIQDAIVSYYGITDLAPSKQEIEDEENELLEKAKELEQVVKKMDEQQGREKLFEKAKKK